MNQALKFEVVHGRQSNLVGGIDRTQGNTYVDSSIRDRELELLEKDQLFGEISGLGPPTDFFGMDEDYIPPPPKPKKKKNKK